MASRALDDDLFSAEWARRNSMQDAGLAGEIFPGERTRGADDVSRRALSDDVAAEFAGAGTEIDDIVGVADCLLVVLDDEDGVAEITERFERAR